MTTEENKSASKTFEAFAAAGLNAELARVGLTTATNIAAEAEGIYAKAKQDHIDFITSVK